MCRPYRILSLGLKLSPLNPRHSGTLNCFCAFVSTIVFNHPRNLTRRGQGSSNTEGHPRIPQGRYYAIRHWQTSKRLTRFLAIGPNAIEIDMKGAHYSLLRLLTCHSPTHPPLPTLLEAREIFSIHLARAPKAQTVQTKHLLQRAVGMDNNAFLRHVYEGSIAAYAIPPALASFLAHLAQAKATLQAMIQQGMPFYQPDARVNNRNWATFALEAAESFVMRRAMLPHCAGTVLWVHDGVYVKNQNSVSPFLEGATEALVQLIQGQHFSPQVASNQEYTGLHEVFAVTTTKCEFQD